MTVVEFKKRKPKRLSHDSLPLAWCRWENGTPIRADELEVGKEYVYTLDRTGRFFIVKEA